MGGAGGEESLPFMAPFNPTLYTVLDFLEFGS